MGTETVLNLIILIGYFFRFVKLNNPLMGTETQCILSHQYLIHQVNR